MYLFSHFAFKTISALTRSQTDSSTPVDDNLDDEFNASGLRIKANKLQALNRLAVPQYIQELLEVQKYDLFLILIQAIKSSDPSPYFYKDDDGLLRCRYSSLPRLRQIILAILSPI